MGQKTRFVALTLVGCALLGSLTARTARAQDAVVVENGRLYADFKTATLFDAVQLVQQAVGRTDYEFADEEMAKATLVPSNTFNNAAWDNIIRTLTNQSGFKIVPLAATGKKSIELRAPAFGEGGEGGYGGSGSGGYPGGGYGGGGYPGGGYSGGGLPATPFAGGRGRGRGGQVQQNANGQTAPGLTGGAASSTEGKDYRLLRVQHVYVGGIAKLFGEGSVISTEEFLLPEGALNGSGGGGGGFGGNQGGFGGQSGFGGQQNGSGFGGQQSGFGSSFGGGGISSAIGSGIGF